MLCVGKNTEEGSKEEATKTKAHEDQSSVRRVDSQLIIS